MHITKLRRCKGKLMAQQQGAQWGDFDSDGTGKGYTLFTRKGKYYTAVAEVDKNDVTGVKIKEGWIVKNKEGKLQTIPTPATPKKKS